MNWGTKIVLGMLVFMMFIMGMVVYMFRMHGHDALIEENYYEKGINYNAEYEAEQRVLNHGAQPKITITQGQIVIQLKDSAQYEVILMRPVNSADDFKQRGNTSGTANLILISSANKPRGLWFLNLKWHAAGKEYLYKNKITL